MIHICCMRDGSSQRLPHVVGHSFDSVAFSPDGRYVVAGSDSGYLWIWGARSRQLLKRWAGHESVVRSVSFQPDGKGMASVCCHYTLKSWNLSSLQPNLHGHRVEDEAKKEVFTCKGHTVCFSLFPLVVLLELTSIRTSLPRSRSHGMVDGSLPHP